MTREPVESSMIASIGYDLNTNTMEIEFNKNGRVYEYYEVPQEEHELIMNADSKGKYFLANIKPHYRCNRVE